MEREQAQKVAAQIVEDWDESETYCVHDVCETSRAKLGHLITDQLMLASKGSLK